MQPHIQNYLQAFGYSGFEFIPCEVCGQKAVDIHHVERRSSFGSRNKEQRDHPNNLVALCRRCHDDAHGERARDIKDQLKDIISSRN